MKRALAILICALTVSCAVFAGSLANDRVRLWPRLQAGEKFVYLVRLTTEKTSSQEGPVIAPMAAHHESLDVSGSLQVEILSVQQQQQRGKAIFSIRTQWKEFSSGGSPAAPASAQDKKISETDAQPVEFTLGSDGAVTSLNGLEDLTSEQQQAWQEWLALFAANTVSPASGVKRGEKWKRQEIERAPSAIAKLVWDRESMYAHDEPCGMGLIDLNGSPSTGGGVDSCAVVFVTSILRQKSSEENATPEDYKLHGLHTAGTAKGTNESILYVSLKTGLLIRATENADQSLDVNVIKVDKSGRVHYKIDAKSRAEVVLANE